MESPWARAFSLRSRPSRFEDSLSALENDYRAALAADWRSPSLPTKKATKDSNRETSGSGKSDAAESPSPSGPSPAAASIAAVTPSPAVVVGGEASTDVRVALELNDDGCSPVDSAGPRTTRTLFAPCGEDLRVADHGEEVLSTPSCGHASLASASSSMAADSPCPSPPPRTPDADAPLRRADAYSALDDIDRRTRSPAASPTRSPREEVPERADDAPTTAAPDAGAPPVDDEESWLLDPVERWGSCPFPMGSAGSYGEVGGTGIVIGDDAGLAQSPATVARNSERLLRMLSATGASLTASSEAITLSSSQDAPLSVAPPVTSQDTTPTNTIRSPVPRRAQAAVFRGPSSHAVPRPARPVASHCCPPRPKVPTSPKKVGAPCDAVLARFMAMEAQQAEEDRCHAPHPLTGGTGTGSSGPLQRCFVRAAKHDAALLSTGTTDAEMVLWAARMDVWSLLE